MQTRNLCYFNGDLIPYPEINLHVSDLQIQRGYGIFDFFRTRNGEIPWLEDYTDRIFQSIRMAEIDVDMTREEFLEIIRTLREKNREDNGAFKVIVTGGYSETLSSATGSPNILVLNIPWKLPPQSDYNNGVNVVGLEYVRPTPEIKTLNYFNTIWLRNKMKQYNAVDVLYHTSTVTECSRANLFFVKRGTVFTPGKNILFGVTRKQVLELYNEVHIQDVLFAELTDFDEIFMASTTRDITPVIGIEGLTIGDGQPGPVTREIQQIFRSRGWM